MSSQSQTVNHLGQTSDLRARLAAALKLENLLWRAMNAADLNMNHRVEQTVFKPSRVIRDSRPLPGDDRPAPPMPDQGRKDATEKKRSERKKTKAKNKRL